MPKDSTLQSAQTTVDAIRLAIQARDIADVDRVVWVVQQILAFAPPSDPTDHLGARAFLSAVEDYNAMHPEGVEPCERAKGVPWTFEELDQFKDVWTEAAVKKAMGGE